MMIKIEDLRADLKSLSEKISDLSKTISLSVIALCWVMLLGGKDAPTLPFPVNRYLLIFAVISALLSLVLGYLQFVAGYACTQAIHDIAEEQKKNEATFDKKSVLYRARTWLFWLKQLLACLSVSLLLVAVVSAMSG